MTAAVSATAKAPSDRFPRKYRLRKPALRLAARLATTPSPSDIAGKIAKAISGPGWSVVTIALFIAGRLPDVGLQLGRVVGPQVVVGHHESREEEDEQATEEPGEEDPP